MAQSVTEWVKVTDDISIISRQSGEVWFHTSDRTKEIAAPTRTNETTTAPHPPC